MAFTKKNSQENKAMQARALALLTEYGWDYDAEDAAETNRWVNPYTKGMIDRATADLTPEFPDVPPKRITSNVSRAMMRLRSAAIRARKAK